MTESGKRWSWARPGAAGWLQFTEAKPATAEAASHVEATAPASKPSPREPGPYVPRRLSPSAVREMVDLGRRLKLADFDIARNLRVPEAVVAAIAPQVTWEGRATAIGALVHLDGRPADEPGCSCGRPTS